MTLDRVNGSALLDESSDPPSSPPPPLGPPTSSLFGFGSLPGTEDEEESPDGLLPDGDPGSATGWPSEDDESDPLDGDPTSSPGSSRADAPAALLSKAQMRATARTAVTISTGMVHTVAAKSEAQRAVGLYLADEDDAAAIGNPLGDLMHRRGDVVGGKLSPEANDFLRALMGVAGYLTKQVQKVGAIRQHEAATAAARNTDVQTYPDAAA